MFSSQTCSVILLSIALYSHDLIYGMVPESHRKLLNNMRKTQQRKERRKREEISVESSNTADDGWPRKRKHDTSVHHHQSHCFNLFIYSQFLF